MMNATEIRELRKRLGLSQVEFAKKVYSTQSMIAKYEKGNTIPRNAVMAHIEALAKTEKL